MAAKEARAVTPCDLAAHYATLAAVFFGLSAVALAVMIAMAVKGLMRR